MTKQMNENQIWEEFWKPIVCDDDGIIDMNQLKKELADFYNVINWVGKVYDHCTGGNLSGCYNEPDLVIKEIEDNYWIQHFDTIKEDLIGMIQDEDLETILEYFNNER